MDKMSNDRQTLHFNDELDPEAILSQKEAVTDALKEIVAQTFMFMTGDDPAPILDRIRQIAREALTENSDD